MGHLVVDQKFKGQDFDGALLNDALHRSNSWEIMAYAMVVDEKTMLQRISTSTMDLLACRAHSKRCFCRGWQRKKNFSQIFKLFDA